MSFELKSEESLRKGIQRIVRKQLENALEELTGKNDNSRDEVVHETRKCFKKVRALLRLIRPKIGEKTYRAKNLYFRDAARPLITEVRNARILIQTLDTLLRHFKDHVAGRSFGEFRKTLQANLRGVRKQVLKDQNAIAVIGELVRQASERVKGWADVPDRWSSIGQGLVDTYRRAAAAFSKASADTTPETLHEWRKQIKYVFYQLAILRPIWPERLEELAREADQMGELLGDNHDLVVLRGMLSDQPDRFGEEQDREALLALIDRRRAELCQEAMLLGGRFFQESPRKFVRSLKCYWKMWRNTTGPEQSAELQPVAG